MEFTLVTPVLNGAQFLKETIAAIGGQSHGDFEHLIIDGGSTDDTLEIARAAAAADSRVRFVEAPGLGQYAAIAQGFDEAAGEILAWLNADDLYLPHALGAVSGHFSTHPESRWASGLPACWDADGALSFVRPEGLWPQGLIRRGWFHKDLLGFIQQESVFFRRSLWRGLAQEDRSRFAAARLAGDFFLWKKFAEDAPLDFIPTVLGGYRRHGANRSENAMDAYMAEAREFGATALPGPLAAFARAIHARRSAYAARRAAENR